MVRLITHNMLACHAKGCTSNNFPLKFKDVDVEMREMEFHEDFIRAFVPRLDWAALVSAAKQLGDSSLPEQQPDMLDDDIVEKLHHVLLEICVSEGAMECPNCGHVYEIQKGIPNMSYESAYLEHISDQLTAGGVDRRHDAQPGVPINGDEDGVKRYRRLCEAPTHIADTHSLAMMGAVTFASS